MKKIQFLFAYNILWVYLCIVISES